MQLLNIVPSRNIPELTILRSKFDHEKIGYLQTNM